MTTLVGRERELAWLRAVTDPAPLFRPRLVVVEGEAGIGKTTLVQARAARAGSRVRWAQGSETGAPGMWMWRRLAPEIGTGDAPDRFALFGALRALLSGGGDLLVVDDVQWADEPSLDLLRMLLTDPGCRGLVCCVTRRTGESGPGWEHLGPRLLAGPDVERLTLRGLDDAAAGALLGAAAQRDLTPDELREATRAGAGNPLHLREVGRLLGAEGRHVGGIGSAGDIDGAITARVGRLDPSTQRLLRAAALLGDEFELTVAARLLETSAAACLPPVSEALAAGVLLDRGSGRFGFAHGLVRTALADRTPLQESVVLHLRAALALEDLHRDDPSRVSAAIARHRIAAAVTGDRTSAVVWARRAGDDAVRALAHEEAARLYDAALTCGGTALAPTERAGLLLARAGAEIAVARFADAFSSCADAVRIGGDPVLADAALTMEAVGLGDPDRTVREWCERALETVTDPSTRTRLLARLAEALYYGGDVTGAAAPAVEALDTAGDDQDALVAALRARQLTCSGPGHTGVRVALAERMTGLGASLRRPAVQMWGRLWAIDAAWERGDLTGIEGELGRLRWCVEQQRSPMAGWHLLVARAALAQARGDLPGAVGLGDEAFRLVAGIGHPAATGARLSLLGAVGHHAGYPPDAFEAMGVDVGEVRENLFARLGPASAFADSGRLDDAAHLYRLTGRPSSWDIPPHFEMPALAVGAGVAVALGDRDDVTWFRTALADRRDGHVVGGGGVASYLGPVAIVLGRCAAALDDLDDAADLLAAAVATCERIGAPGFAVEAAVELAAVRMRRREADAARSSLARVRPVAARLGMEPWLRRIDGLLGGTAGPLTAREREVAELVALGRSNREIAAQLVLSERTVGNHVQHILTKLDFTNRSQVTAWVLTRG